MRNILQLGVLFLIFVSFMGFGYSIESCKLYINGNLPDEGCQSLIQTKNINTLDGVNLPYYDSLSSDPQYDSVSSVLNYENISLPYGYFLSLKFGEVMLNPNCNLYVFWKLFDFDSGYSHQNKVCIDYDNNVNNRNTNIIIDGKKILDITSTTIGDPRENDLYIKIILNSDFLDSISKESSNIKYCNYNQLVYSDGCLLKLDELNDPNEIILRFPENNSIVSDDGIKYTNLGISLSASVNGNLGYLIFDSSNASNETIAKGALNINKSNSIIVFDQVAIRFIQNYDLKTRYLRIIPVFETKNSNDVSNRLCEVRSDSTGLTQIPGTYSFGKAVGGIPNYIVTNNYNKIKVRNLNPDKDICITDKAVSSSDYVCFFIGLNERCIKRVSSESFTIWDSTNAHELPIIEDVNPSQDMGNTNNIQSQTTTDNISQENDLKPCNLYNNGDLPDIGCSFRVDNNPNLGGSNNFLIGLTNSSSVSYNFRLSVNKKLSVSFSEKDGFWTRAKLYINFKLDNYEINNILLDSNNIPVYYNSNHFLDISYTNDSGNLSSTIYIIKPNSEWLSNVRDSENLVTPNKGNCYSTIFGYICDN